MLYTSLGAFALSAVLGLTILVRWLTKKDASKGVIYSHGIVAALALALLVIYAIQHPDHFPTISLVLFIISALGGFYMFFRDLAKKNSPMAVAFIHALLAVSGVVTLLLFIFE